MNDEPIVIRGKPYVVRKSFSDSTPALSFFVGRPREADGWIPGARGTVARLHAEIASPSGAENQDGTVFPPYECRYGQCRPWDGIAIRINDLIIDDGERGRGIGTAVLSRLESYASGLRRADGKSGKVLVYGIPAPEGDSDGEMEKLLAFYRGSGYAAVGEFVEKIVASGR